MASSIVSDITYEELTLAATVNFLKISLAFAILNMSDITYEELTLSCLPLINPTTFLSDITYEELTLFSIVLTCSHYCFRRTLPMRN